jgi:hypothetical protein
MLAYLPREARNRVLAEAAKEYDISVDVSKEFTERDGAERGESAC